MPVRPSIRGEYERAGADAFYRAAGSTYRNPHEPQVRQILRELVAAGRLGLSHVLDLAAGSGEVTLVLRELGVTRIDAIDPYTGPAYLARTGQRAEPLTFAGIADGRLAGRSYSLIVCSFALHLCEPSRLPGICTQLAAVSRQLLILTPHKRPFIRAQWGWRLTHEQVIERVRARLYASGAPRFDRLAATRLRKRLTTTPMPSLRSALPIPAEAS